MKEMRKKEKEITFQETEELLKKAEVGILSTVDEFGQPYGVPINYVYANEVIYFHCALEGYKLDNIQKNNRVCFTIYGGDEIIPNRFTTKFESVVAFGKAEIVHEEEKIKALILLVEKLSPGFEKEGLEYIQRAADKTTVVKIKIEKMTGKKGNPSK